MKSIFAITCCLALLTGLAAAEQENPQHKKKKGDQAEPAQQVQGQGGKKGKQGRAGRRGLNDNAAQANQLGQGNKASRHLQRQENRNAVQANQLDQGNKASRHLQRQENRISRAESNNVQAQGRGRAQIRHFNIANSPNPKIQSVKFRQSYRIAGAENWRGERYNAFRVYRPQWHDRGWWSSHHSRIVLIGGGWYYWNAGFWYPAWGYDSVHAYYPYDGPIYAYNDLPPDQVVANVQEALQTQGYYHGEVDGLLGPLTRAALADYQRDRGLYTTAAIDQPTLESLGFA